ncbi:acetyl-CoA acetyltransferase [Candidatus Photodesmus katoptron]|uniref:acetyl-CoA C-acetyltransferase n=1 Tax=Candidatus Photodesmus anomalopis TaxID=28176 RepID=UPI0004D38271|nr:acetyl-CoA C-acetyltransferase [Candidatus Photodesmus katoptron]KEY90604.1 acetyl-CoA acetyltransferase [Candidatus Photodesmus katoptron]
MKKVYAISGKRTPIGAFCGSLKGISAGKLASIAIEGALASAKVSPSILDEVIIGNVISAGQGMGIARQAAIYAGIPKSVPAYGINMVCGSGMKAVMDGVAHIKNNDADIVIAGGVEVMSQIPFILPSSIRSGHKQHKMGNLTLIDLLISDGLTDAYTKHHMGMTAETIAKEFSITRKQQDSYAMTSQFKAVDAIKKGKFLNEIETVNVSQPRKSNVFFDTDEYPRKEVKLSELEKLAPAFQKEGTVTAGNSSGLNDGASAMVLASEESIEKYNLSPIAEIISYAQSALEPEMMGLGPVNSIKKALNKAQLSISDINLYELNEAFAVQTLAVIHKLADEYNVSVSSILDKTNVNGGAISLGHPLGASGNRILVTLMHELNRNKKKSHFGIAALCIGGGMGTAVIIKTVT